jgi:hypothetical protein
VILAILNRRINQLGVFGFLGSREDEGGIGGGILRLVLLNCYATLAQTRSRGRAELTEKVAGVADNGLLTSVSTQISSERREGGVEAYGASGLELLKR